MSDTKEAILDKLEIQSQGDYFRKDVLKAMDGYARQEAVGFWKFMSTCDYYTDGEDVVVEGNNHDITIGRYPIEELYNIYLKHQQP